MATEEHETLAFVQDCVLLQGWEVSYLLCRLVRVDMEHSYSMCAAMLRYTCIFYFECGYFNTLVYVFCVSVLVTRSDCCQAAAD